MPASGDPGAASGELLEKNKGLEEEIQRLKAENIELRRDIYEKQSKMVHFFPVFWPVQDTESVTKNIQELTEEMVLNSTTFGTLLGQAEQMAQDYVELKGKYSNVKARYKELCIKYENDLKEVLHQEAKRVQQIIDEVTAASAQSEKASESPEQAALKAESERYYRNVIDLHKANIATLEADLVQAKKQIEALKNDRKKATEVVKDVVTFTNGEKDSEKIEKLTAALQQKSQELAGEKQMGDMWISELEVTSKAYDQEKKKNKLLSQEV